MSHSAFQGLLFAYGTLVFPEIWRRVSGDSAPRRAQSATLEGFVLRRVRDADFPAIAASPGAPAVAGLVYHDLDPATLARLDAYEDAFYQRIPVEAVAVADGAPIPCQAYVVPSHLRARILSDDDWNAAEFKARHLADFILRNFA